MITFPSDAVKWSPGEIDKKAAGVLNLAHKLTRTKT